MPELARIISALNQFANFFGRALANAVAPLPGWLSATVIGVLTGVVMLVGYKYTSNQRAIKRVRDQMKANMLSLKLFKDNMRSVFGSQLGLVGGAGKLLLHSLLPMVVMFIPITLAMTQLSLWYQMRPLQVGETAVVSLQLRDDTPSPLPDVKLDGGDFAEIVTGPVRIDSTKEVTWEIVARTTGLHELQFDVNGELVTKSLSIGDRYLRVSLLRPTLKSWGDVVLNPAEKPFAVDSAVQSIAIAYPERDSWTSGTDNWVIYWLVVSMVAAFALKSVFNVNL